MPSQSIAALVRAIQRRQGFDPSLVDDDGPTLADVPSKAALAADARDRFAQALEEYDRINKALSAQPIVPGRYYSVGRWIVRGEFEDVPRRWLDLSQRPATGAFTVEGSLDDRAAELGFDDGDALRAWMLDARRPVAKDFERRTGPTPPYTAADVRAVQCALAAESGCRGRNVAEYCSKDTAEAVLREALAGRGEKRYRQAVMAGSERIARCRDRRKEAGKCTRCGQPAREAKTTCESCNANARAAVYASRERARLDKAIAKELGALQAS
jgi:hypothetical protein